MTILGQPNRPLPLPAAIVILTAFALLATACAETPTAVGQPAFAKGGNGKPGTGSGPNAEIFLAGGVATSPANVTHNALIVADNGKRHETNACCNEDGDADSFDYLVQVELIATAAACTGVLTSEALSRLAGGPERGSAVIVKIDRHAGTGSMKFIWNEQIEGWGQAGPFGLILSGEVQEDAGLVFTLGDAGGTLLFDWPTNFADAQGLPETETCGSLADVVTVDVNPF